MQTSTCCRCSSAAASQPERNRDVRPRLMAIENEQKDAERRRERAQAMIAQRPAMDPEVYKAAYDAGYRDSQLCLQQLLIGRLGSMAIHQRCDQPYAPSWNAGRIPRFFRLNRHGSLTMRLIGMLTPGLREQATARGA